MSGERVASITKRKWSKMDEQTQKNFDMMEKFHENPTPSDESIQNSIDKVVKKYNERIGGDSNGDDIKHNR